MQILDILDNRSIECTFKSDPIYIDMWHFIHQMRSINNHVMTHTSQKTSRNTKTSTLRKNWCRT